MGRAALLLALAAACSSDVPRPLRPAPGPAIARVDVHLPDRLRGISAEYDDFMHIERNVACNMCHSMRQPKALPQSPAELDEFHQGLVFRHGTLSCGSCHLLGDQTALRRADGTAIPLLDAIELCRQCHGPQARDFDHGAHGGMSGHWDLSVGPRTRNHCVDCHDAHAPQIPASRPVLPPADRGLTRAGALRSSTTQGARR